MRARAAPLLGASRERLVDCGDGVRLQAFEALQSRSDPTRPLAIFLHGWEGSADSPYVLSSAQALYAQGLDVVRLNLRDHGDTHHLNQELFHSCRLTEVARAIASLHVPRRTQPLMLVGFSLGGNFMLRVTAAAPGFDIDVAQTVAISPVLDPARTLIAMEGRFNIYHAYFVRKWARSLRRKQQAWPDAYDFEAMLGNADLRRMTEQMVLRHTEYQSLSNYLDGYALTGARLAALAAPATIITALDDPIIPAADLAALATSDRLEIVTTRYGGHCGFSPGLGQPSWVDEVIAARIPRPASSSSQRS